MTDRSTATSGEAVLVVHYGELALKGRNRPNFERTLIANLKGALGERLSAGGERPRGRLLFPVASGASDREIEEIVRRVYGIANFALARRLPCALQEICAAAIEQARAAVAASGGALPSFAVRARRADKRFPMSSPEINREVGAAVVVATGLRVDLESPDLEIRVEVLSDTSLVYSRSVQGAGGLPVGTGGRVTALLSGGIDSPVAADLMMKRGCRVRLLHFHSAPFTSAASQEKVFELARILALRQGEAYLDSCAFAGVQEEIIARAPARYRVLLYRRFMVRIACELARKHHTLALVTGESLGQVASQTLENLGAIEAVATMPVLRPLLAYDKQEIITRARELGTYELSIQPHDDCCSFMMPERVATRASAAELDRAEADLDIPTLVKAGLETVTSEPVIP